MTENPVPPAESSPAQSGDNPEIPTFDLRGVVIEDADELHESLTAMLESAFNAGRMTQFRQQEPLLKSAWDEAWKGGHRAAKRMSALSFLFVWFSSNFSMNACWLLSYRTGWDDLGFAARAQGPGGAAMITFLIALAIFLYWMALRFRK